MARRRSITERDVRRAVDERQGSLDVRDAAITPSAIDLAHRLGLTLSGLRHEDRRLRQSGKPVPPSPESRVQSPEGPRPADSRETRIRQPVSAETSTSLPGALRIAIGADHGGVVMKDAIVARLREKGHSVVDHGTHGSEAVDYPDFALKVAREVAAGAADLGIMVDGAGIGSCMVGNKVPGVRAAMCHDVTTAENAREHNDANMLTLGGGLLGQRLALAIVDRFLATPFAGGRHARRVQKINAL